jgi:steroid 5-alpha reductase family enzyme
MSSLIVAGTTIFIYMNVLNIIAKLTKNAGYVDIGWGVGFVVVAWTLLLQAETVTKTQVLLVILTSLWGLRLGWHIAKRNIGKPEDWRYQNWRRDWGKNYWWRAYLQIFMLQGVMMLLISASAVVLFETATNPPLWLVVSGVSIWLVGYLFEVVGDWQLAQFVKTKQTGEIMTSGLWRYTRHPNYFGEVVQWWGLWLLVAAVENGWLALISPLTITILITRISGVPMLEKKYADKPQFQAYAKRTNKFFPGPPRSSV